MLGQTPRPLAAGASTDDAVSCQATSQANNNVYLLFSKNQNKEKRKVSSIKARENEVDWKAPSNIQALL